MRISHTSAIKTFTVGLAATIAISTFGVNGASATTSSATPAPVRAQSVQLPKFGETSETVKLMQSALMKNGFTLVGGADGKFSPRTRATLRSFQKVVGLKATGNLDRKTAKVLGLLTPAPVPAPVVAPAPVPAPVVAPVAAPVAAPAPAAFAFTPETLPVIGAKGEPVVALQNALILAGIQVRGGADGLFGNGTKMAISTFQKSKNIAASGAVDSDTAIELGLLPRPVLEVTLAVFPVQPACYFIDTWHEARGATRKHEGVDIIANRGTPLLAVNDGIITRTYDAAKSALSGNALRLTMADGTYFFYAHLDSFAPGIAIGTPVTAGQVIGFVGSTGNTNTPHLHFEVHPKGGAPINPFPIVKAIDGCKKK
jgi:murein DD-endopeptidase MepM/ murein hydrolase activator NlpD